MMTTISMLAIDLAKGSFQVCAIGLDGAVLYNRVLSRTRLTNLLAEQPACVVAMEACATSHYWGRVAQSHGHEVRLVPAVYVKPFVKRHKNDKADAEAIAEAVSSESAGCFIGGGRRSWTQLPPSITTSGLIGQCFDQLAVGGDGARSPRGATACPGRPAGILTFSVWAPTQMEFQALAGDSISWSGSSQTES